MPQIILKLDSGKMPQHGRHITFGVERVSRELFLTFPDGTRFALLDVHTAKALANVIDLPLVQFEALADLIILRETIGKATKASDATLPVNINVYGSQESRKDVAYHLSVGKIYLQHPDQQRPDSVYDNPHILKLPGIPNQIVDFEPPDTCESVSRGNHASQFQHAVSNVYASLKRSSHLKKVVGDMRLRTCLLP